VDYASMSATIIFDLARQELTTVCYLILEAFGVSKPVAM